MTFEEIINELDVLRFIFERKRDRERADTGVFRASSRRLVAINAAIDLLRTHPDNQPNDPEGDGWIRVDDKLPKVCENVLAVCAEAGRPLGQPYGRDKW